MRQKIWEIYSTASRQIVVENIKKYIEVYDNEWIVIHEALQNSIDAIQMGPHESGEINITLFPAQEKVRIEDNGKGFPPKLDLLAPAMTDKNAGGATKGYQGVGLKALMYSTEFFSIESQHKGSHWTFIADNLFHLLQGGDPDCEEETADARDSTTWTILDYTFPNKLVTEFLEVLFQNYNEDDNWCDLYSQLDKQDSLFARMQHVVRWYFQTKTYVGDCNRLIGATMANEEGGDYKTDIKKILIRLTIDLNEDFDNCPAVLKEYINLTKQSEITFKFENKQWDFEEIIAQSTGKRKYSIAPDIERFSLTTFNWSDTRYLKDRVYIRKLLPNRDETDFSKKYEEFISLLTNRNIEDIEKDYGRLFEKLHGIYLVIGRTSMFEKYGLENRGHRFIAVNGIPTTHTLSADVTSSTWYLQTIHCIINIDAKLNYGKKQTPNTYLINRANSFFTESYRMLMRLSKCFVRDRREDPNDSVITTNFMDMPTIEIKGINIVREPEDENTLIALFFQLLQILKYEIQIYGLVQHGIYDGKFRWNADQDPKVDNLLLNLEFKVKLSNLLEDFENPKKDKDFNNTNLIIVWTDSVPTRFEDRWKIRGIDQSRRTSLRASGVPEYIKIVLEEKLTAYYRPLICVKSLVGEILNETR